MTDFWRWTAVEIAAAVGARRVSSREVVESHLDRIARVNPAVNAITRILADEALANAAELDEALVRGAIPGPLAGVPVTVKENIDLAGSPTTMGVAALRADLPLGDAPHVAQLKAAGAIPIARTNLPDYALRWHTENDLHGRTLNPWDPSLTCGGSSGGDAAALATGMTPIGLGNDIAGSLRWPSQCCGTAALKPSHGRVPRARRTRTPVLRSLASQAFAVHGPMARHAGDLWRALNSMSGYSPGDPAWVPAPLDGPPRLAPVRVAMMVDPAGVGVDPAVAEAVHTAGKALAAGGYAVEELEPPDFARAVEIYWQCLGDLAAGAKPEHTGESFGRYRAAFAGAYAEVRGEPSPDPWADRYELARRWSEWMDATPLILAPVATCRPFPVGFDETGPAEALQWLTAARAIVVVNLFGLPAVALPTGVVDGIPRGVQVIGPRFREDLCIAAAEVIEEHCGVLTPIEPR